MDCYPLVKTSVALAQRTFETRFCVRYWDNSMVAAVLEHGCHTIYSENLNNDSDCGSVTALNPFIEII